MASPMPLDPPVIECCARLPSASDTYAKRGFSRRDARSRGVLVRSALVMPCGPARSAALAAALASALGRRLRRRRRRRSRRRPPPGAGPRTSPIRRARRSPSCAQGSAPGPGARAVGVRARAGHEPLRLRPLRPRPRARSPTRRRPSTSRRSAAGRRAGPVPGALRVARGQAPSSRATASKADPDAATLGLRRRHALREGRATTRCSASSGSTSRLVGQPTRRGRCG